MFHELDEIVTRLSEHFGRLPTEDEVVAFIVGDDKARDHILSKAQSNA